jgi:glycine cleavage system H protein
MSCCRGGNEGNVMADDYLEFSILSDRKYTRNHLWMQLVDKEEETWKIGVSDLRIQEMGDILRVTLAVLPSDALADNAAADNEFDFADVAEEFSEGDILFSLSAAGVKDNFHSPCAGKVLEVNNELEATPELVTDDTYSEGWIILIDPHDFDEDQLLTADEYIESLSE